MHILVVEDDVRLAEALARILEDNGYTVDTVHDGQAGIDYGSAGIYDVIILDVMLPKADGFTVAQSLRREHVSTPILLLTARDATADKITGLDSGADDYMTKPFSIAVLRARIQALRRRLGEKNKNAYAGDGFSFDFEKLKFFANGQEIFLSVNEQRLLRLLVENPGRILTREVLVDRIWGDGEYVDENALSVTVRRLRAKLEDEETHGSCIQTVYGQGYMWKNG